MTAVRMKIRRPDPWAAFMGAVGGGVSRSGVLLHLPCREDELLFGTVIGWIFGLLFVLKGSLMAVPSPRLAPSARLDRLRLAGA
jgi:hypothetical protein